MRIPCPACGHDIEATETADEIYCPDCGRPYILAYVPTLVPVVGVI